MRFEDYLGDLAAKTSGGDPTAAREFRDRLKPQMTLMARQVMRRGQGRTPLARRILTEAQRLTEKRQPDSTGFLDNVLGRIVEDLCDSIIERLRNTPEDRQATKDTVRM